MVFNAVSVLESDNQLGYEHLIDHMAFNGTEHFEKNDLDSYSLNNLTAKQSTGGAYTVQFGGCTAATLNCLVTPAGWSYVVRLYRPRRPILDGTWIFPEAKPVN